MFRSSRLIFLIASLVWAPLSKGGSNETEAVDLMFSKYFQSYFWYGADDSVKSHLEVKAIAPREWKEIMSSVGTFSSPAKARLILLVVINTRIDGEKLEQFLNLFYKDREELSKLLLDKSVRGFVEKSRAPGAKAFARIIENWSKSNP